MTLTRSGPAIAWGEADWEVIEDLECDPVTVSAAGRVDICGLFAEEVGKLRDPEVIIRESVPDPTRVDYRAPEIRLSLEDARPDDNDRRGTGLHYGQGDGRRNLYAAIHGTSLVGWNPRPWVIESEDLFHDADDDPKYGDLGKVDRDGDDRADNFVGDADAEECSADDGGTEKEENLPNGSLRDAEGVEVEMELTVDEGLGLGCEETVIWSLVCDWDADGGQFLDGDRRLPNPSPRDLTDFLSCEIAG